MFDNPEFQVQASVDKRGRQLPQKKQSRDAERLYTLKDAAEWKEDAEDEPSKRSQLPNQAKQKGGKAAGGSWAPAAKACGLHVPA